MVPPPRSGAGPTHSTGASINASGRSSPEEKGERQMTMASSSTSARTTSDNGGGRRNKNNNNNNSIKKHDDTIPPTIISGVPRMKRYMMLGATTLTVGYVSLLVLLRDSSSYLTPAKEHCAVSSSSENNDNNNDNDNDDNQRLVVVCSRPDLFAFQIVPGLAMLVGAVFAFYTWHVSRRVHDGLPATPEGRLFGYLPESEQLAAASVTFQVWDFFVSLTIREHRTPIMLAHHILAAAVSYFSLEYQYLHYYGIFYLGLSEVSSIFLILINLAKHFPPTPGSWMHSIVEFGCGPLFVITFVYYRIYLWFKVNMLLWSDAYHVLYTSGTAETLRPGKSFVLYLFLTINVPLTILQVYWFLLIVGQSSKVVTSILSEF